MKHPKHINSKVYTIPAIVIGLAIVACFYYLLFMPVFKIDKTEYIYVDQDDNIDSVMTKINHYVHPTRSAGISMLARHLEYGKHIHTGRYAIHTGTNALQVYRMLRNGQQEPLMLTIPSVRTVEKLSAYLGRKLMMDSAQVASRLLNEDFCRQWDYDTTTIMCLFIPNTYEVYWDVTFNDFMQRMRTENEHFWNTSRMEKAHTLQLTPNQVITLASIVDEETANNAEKPMVAGMYLNRLSQGMPLQADPTVKFALKDFALKRIYHKHLEVNSPYNTYRNTGLPPGPIRIPSVAGIDAVLNRTPHHYIYMCAKEDFSGTHNFAVTYAEHQRNAARYVKALNERNIK